MENRRMQTCTSLHFYTYLFTAVSFFLLAGCGSNEEHKSKGKEIKINTDLQVKVIDAGISNLPTNKLHQTASFDVDDDAPFRVGFNFIREKEGTSYDSSSSVLADISEVGGQGMRQFQGFGVSWFNTMVCSDFTNSSCYDFSAVDEYFKNTKDIYPLPTLFSLGNSLAAQHVSGDDSADCEDDDHKKADYCRYPVLPSGEVLDIDDDEIRTKVESYVKEVVSQYKDNGIRHFEVLNEPSNYIYKYGISELGLYSYYYKPQDYVDLLSTVKTAAKSKNSNVKIVMAGLFHQDLQDGHEMKWEDWFDKILKKGAGNYIDAVNFHYYGKWKNLKEYICRVKEIMNDRDVSKPIWMTEVGSSATQKSQEEQAKDVFKYFAVAFGNGVQLANWHTHISRHNGTSGYGGYGTRTSGGKAYKSWKTYQLFAEKFGNFGSCSAIKEGGSNGVWVYKCSGSLYSSKQSMPTRYIAWVDDEHGTNNYDLSFDYPSSWSQVKITQTVDSSGSFQESTQSTSKKLALSTTPVIIEESEN